MTQALADPQEGAPPEPELLEFLAEVSQATGEGFDAWLATEIETDHEKDDSTEIVGEKDD